MKFSTFRILLSNGNISLMDIRNDNIQLKAQGLIFSRLSKTKFHSIDDFFHCFEIKDKILETAVKRPFSDIHFCHFSSNILEYERISSFFHSNPGTIV